nr:hypothetical protein [uncultured Rhodopila sp.]
MKGTVPFVEIAIGDTDIWAIGPEAATGMSPSCVTNSDNPPREQSFVAAYQKKYRKHPAYKAWMGWITARSLFEFISPTQTSASSPAIPRWFKLFSTNQPRVLTRVWDRSQVRRHAPMIRNRLHH